MGGGEAFERWALATFDLAGIEVDVDDLGLIRLVYDGAITRLQALDGADTTEFPFESVDPGRPPEHRL